MSLRDDLRALRTIIDRWDDASLSDLRGIMDAPDDCETCVTITRGEFRKVLAVLARLDESHGWQPISQEGKVIGNTSIPRYRLTCKPVAKLVLTGDDGEWMKAVDVEQHIQELARQVESKVSAEYPNKAERTACEPPPEKHPSTHSATFPVDVEQDRAALLKKIETLEEELRCERASVQPTEQPDRGGRLVLNAYGRRCYESGREAAEAENARLREQLQQIQERT